MGALLLGDVQECERILEDIGRMRRGPSFGAGMAEAATRAELALARGATPEALRLYDEAVLELSEVRFPGMETSGFEPWTLVAEATALMAHVRHASSPAEQRRRDELAASLHAKGSGLVGHQTGGFVDYPITGMVLAAVGAWVLERTPDAETGIRLLAIAERFAYNRMFPVMAWAPLAEAAERVAPGRLAAALQEYAGRGARELSQEAADLIARVEVPARLAFERPGPA